MADLLAPHLSYMLAAAAHYCALCRQSARLPAPPSPQRSPLYCLPGTARAGCTAAGCASPAPWPAVHTYGGLGSGLGLSQVSEAVHQLLGLQRECAFGFGGLQQAPPGCCRPGLLLTPATPALPQLLLKGPPPTHLDQHGGRRQLSQLQVSFPLSGDRLRRHLSVHHIRQIAGGKPARAWWVGLGEGGVGSWVWLCWQQALGGLLRHLQRPLLWHIR